MKNVIVYDRNTSCKWDSKKGFNFYFLNSVREFSFEVLKSRGYLYLDELYRLLGIGWNPDDENLLFRYDENNPKFIYNIGCRKEDEFVLLLNY